MDSGEKELRKIFEETTTNNVKAVLAHSNETRKLVRELEQKIVLLEGLMRNQNILIGNFKVQLANIQTKVYNKGTT